MQQGRQPGAGAAPAAETAVRGGGSASGGGGDSRVGGGKRRWRRPGAKAAAGGGGSGSRVGGGQRRGRRPGAVAASGDGEALDCSTCWLCRLPTSPVHLNENGRAKVARAADQMPTTAVNIFSLGRATWGSMLPSFLSSPLGLPFPGTLVQGTTQDWQTTQSLF